MIARLATCACACAWAAIAACGGAPPAKTAGVNADTSDRAAVLTPESAETPARAPATTTTAALAPEPPRFDCGERWSLPAKTDRANVTPVAPDDAELAKARARARETLATFRRALAARPRGFTFSLKVGLPTPRKVPEHIWVSGVTADGDGFRGALDNEPVDLPGMKAGDPVAIKPEQVEDWSILDEGTRPPTICGGFTTRVLLGR